MLNITIILKFLVLNILILCIAIIVMYQSFLDCGLQDVAPGTRGSWEGFAL